MAMTPRWIARKYFGTCRTKEQDSKQREIEKSTVDRICLRVLVAQLVFVVVMM